MSLEYQEALRAADASPSTASRRALLKIMRVAKVRAPQVVLRHGGALLASWSAASALGDEVWTVREQVLLAALDANDAGMAARQLEALDTKFPGSSRVRRLLGMAHEQRGERNDRRPCFGTSGGDEPRVERTSRGGGVVDETDAGAERE